MITYNFGSAPYEEDCARVGDPSYSEQARLECRIYGEQLERMAKDRFPTVPIKLRTKTFPHDFGSYLEVVGSANESDEATQDALGWLESEVPARWDAEAREALGLETTPSKDLVLGALDGLHDFSFEGASPQAVLLVFQVLGAAKRFKLATDLLNRSKPSEEQVNEAARVLTEEVWGWKAPRSRPDDQWLDTILPRRNDAHFVLRAMRDFQPNSSDVSALARALHQFDYDARLHEVV